MSQLAKGMPCIRVFEDQPHGATAAANDRKVFGMRVQHLSASL